MADQQNPQNPAGGTPPPTPPPTPPLSSQHSASPTPPPYHPPSPPSPQSPPSPAPPYPSASSAPQGAAGQYDMPVGSPGVQGTQAVPGTSGTPPPPKPPSPPANFQLGAFLPKELKIPVPKHSLTFNEDQFLRLLAGSISLTKDEKIRIIDSIPKLKQTQVDELIRIFEEEKRKFAELGQEHVPQLERLAKQHYEDWVDIEMHYSQQTKKGEESKQAEELRKKLGLN